VVSLTGELQANLRVVCLLYVFAQGLFGACCRSIA
jgi:hypothetical protein